MADETNIKLIDRTTEYLKAFKTVAEAWFGTAANIRAHYGFFQDFFKRENLEKAKWTDIQEIGAHLYCFQTMALAKAKALGKPNHSIEHYRKSFLYLAHGPGSPNERIRQFRKDAKYKLRNFGKSAVSELIGYLFPDQFMFVNERDRFAIDFLKVKVQKQVGGELAAELEEFNKATRPLAKQYLDVVGKQTDLPLNLEVDQFFSWLYKNYSSEDKKGDGVADSVRQYWTLSAGTGGEQWEDFYRTGIIAIGWEGTPDLRQFKTKDEIGKFLFKQLPGKGSKKNDKHACWQFVHDIQKGDIVFAKQGERKIKGYGIVVGDYEFDSVRPEFKHVRKIRWLSKGNWDLPKDRRMAQKALTNISPYPDFVKLIASKVGLDLAEAHDWNQLSKAVPFTITDALNGLFMQESQLRLILARLKRKKALILQGPPGVGKTFIARRLAFALMGERDDRRIAMVQFHPSYGYEDFVQGYRPAGLGLERRDGVFYQFARLAGQNPSQDWFFVIDEINRGNLAKIFGEMLMLIEADKRGPNHAIPLTYSADATETFYIPENLHIIGTMNTADRSLAMVDYALRRRFAFVTLEPAFGSTEFGTWLTGLGVSAELLSRIRDRLAEVNAEIAKERDLGHGFQIGHSFFCPYEGQSPVDETWYREIIEGEIRPLLEEYFDSHERVEKLIFGLQS